MSSATKDNIRRAHWIAAAGLFICGLIIDLMDGHSQPAVQTLITYAQVLAMAVFIVGCLLVLVGRIDRIVREPEGELSPVAALPAPAAMVIRPPAPDPGYLADMAESVEIGREIERRKGEPPLAA